MSDNAITRPSLLMRLRELGNDQSWREFDAAYSDLIVRYARACGLQFADAEEVCQLVLSKLSRSMGSFDYDSQRDRFRDYLRRCVRNAVSSFSSRHKPPGAQVYMDEATLTASDEVPDQTWEEEWGRHHYRRALQSLQATTDSRTPAVFDEILRGGDFASLAQRFETSEANIRKIKQRMRERLQQTIRRPLADEEACEDLT